MTTRDLTSWAGAGSGVQMRAKPHGFNEFSVRYSIFYSQMSIGELLLGSLRPQLGAAADWLEGARTRAVLKALFNGIELKRIIGLASRRNAELSRMAADYADERRAAGRSVPPDISLAMLHGMAAQRAHR